MSWSRPWGARRRTRRTGRGRRAERTGLSKSTIGRVWKAFGLTPHRTEGLKLSSDPLFTEKVYDIVCVYLDLPESAGVHSVDEKSQLPSVPSLTCNSRVTSATARPDSIANCTASALN